MKENKSIEIIQELLTKIVHGEIMIGKILPSVEDYAKEYEISRTVMREVYLALVSKKLIRSVPRLGSVVQPQDQWNWWDTDILNAAVQNKNDRSKIIELTNYRLMLEPAVCETAATTATLEDISAIEEGLQRLKESLDSIEQWAEADVRFHELILKATHNDLMVQLGKGLYKPFYYGRLNGKDDDFLKEINFIYQEQIIEAIKMKQPPLARHFMYHLILMQK